jgi:gamma-glutamyltranspeptidase
MKLCKVLGVLSWLLAGIGAGHARAQTGAGGVQVIMRGAGFYRAGSDFRKDGEAVGW